MVPVDYGVTSAWGDVSGVKFDAGVLATGSKPSARLLCTYVRETK